MRIEDGIFKLTQLALVGCLAVFVFFAALFGKEGYFARQELLGEMAKLQAVSKELDQTIESYQKEIYALEHDMGYIEKIARDELGMIKPGEIVYRQAKRKHLSNSRRN